MSRLIWRASILLSYKIKLCLVLVLNANYSDGQIQSVMFLSQFSMTIVCVFSNKQIETVSISYTTHMSVGYWGGISGTI